MKKQNKLRLNPEELCLKTLQESYLYWCGSCVIINFKGFLISKCSNNMETFKTIIWVQMDPECKSSLQILNAL